MVVEIRADFGDMKRVLNEDIYHKGFVKGMYEAAGVIMLAAKEEAPVFDGPAPLYGYPQKSTFAPGTFKESIKVVPMGVMMLITARSVPGDLILSGYPTMTTPGQHRWMHANYPNGYPAKHGKIVPPNKFPEKIAAVDTVFLISIVAGEIENALKGAL